MRRQKYAEMKNSPDVSGKTNKKRRLVETALTEEMIEPDPSNSEEKMVSSRISVIYEEQIGFVAKATKPFHREPEKLLKLLENFQLTVCVSVCLSVCNSLCRLQSNPALFYIAVNFIFLFQKNHIFIKFEKKGPP